MKCSDDRRPNQPLFMNFSPSKYSTLKSKLRKRFQHNTTKMFIDLKSNPESAISIWLHQNAKELREYSSIKWYFISQVRQFNFFALKSASLKNDIFGPLEEQVFERWNNSEFADHFLKALNRGLPLSKASQTAMAIYDEHLVTLGNRQLLRQDVTSKGYREQSSLGEWKRGKKLGRLLQTTLHIEGKDLGLLTKNLKEMKTFSHRIENALSVIRRFSPSSWQRFVAFTEVIVPIAQEEFVSYSHQDLPGYSMINLYHRDFVDLLDDLLHENGHHHLNFYLNLGKLIEEPLDNIYYSPWRRTLRPLRGIFHAYFTFFWAFKLFSDLVKAKDVDSIFYLFSEAEKEKITFRAIEEYYMLNYCYEDLRWARKRGLIADQGWELIREQRKELLKFKGLLPRVEKTLRNHRSELKELKATLRKAKLTYARN